MSDIIYSRLKDAELLKLREFCFNNWPGEHPLIHNEEMFDFYYRRNDGINIVAAYDEGEIIGLCGFLVTNSGDTPDIFLSYILSKKGAGFGISLRLIETIRELTNARTINCNNIRKKTGGIYEFLGYTVGDMSCYYRLNSNHKEYKLCRVKNIENLKIQSRQLQREDILSIKDLSSFPFEKYRDNRPYKDREYFVKRYFEYPFFEYIVIKIYDNDKEALVVARRIEYEESSMLRLVDFVGERELIKESGLVLDQLIEENDVEYMDWYSYGTTPNDLYYAGFKSCNKEEGDIIPLYLSPPVLENIDITVFSSDNKDFMMFRADGDQDRPNLG